VASTSMLQHHIAATALTEQSVIPLNVNANNISTPSSMLISQTIPSGMIQPSVSSVVHQSTLGSNSAMGVMGECTICYEQQIDSVLYMCGHMCMCYRCAVQQWRGKGGGQCPMCRAPIRDVIRTYKS
jgi:protein neuralized